MERSFYILTHPNFVVRERMEVDSSLSEQFAHRWTVVRDQRYKVLEWSVWHVNVSYFPEELENFQKLQDWNTCNWVTLMSNETLNLCQFQSWVRTILKFLITSIQDMWLPILHCEHLFHYNTHTFLSISSSRFYSILK
jgi:hypothetical protein